MKNLKRKLLSALIAMTAICGVFGITACGNNNGNGGNGGNGNNGGNTEQGGTTQNPDDNNSEDNELKATEGLEYSLSEDGTYYLCSGIGTATDTDIVIASQYNNKPVTAIGDLAFFQEDSNITSMFIPEGVTFIDYYAFYGCVNLKNITIPDSVTYIGGGAFDRCDNLEFNEYDKAVYLGNSSNPYHIMVGVKDETITSCKINENAKVIASHAFNDCSELTSVILPNSVLSVCDCAFRYCVKLASITIPDNVTFIGEFAFGGCDTLTSITIPESITHIGEDVFMNSYALTDIIYKGTEEQWNLIEKDKNWNRDTGEYTIHYIDGDKSK